VKSDNEHNNLQHAVQSYLVSQPSLKYGLDVPPDHRSFSHSFFFCFLAQADREYKIKPTFTVDVLNEQGEAVARVEKLLYVRRKNGRQPE